MNQTTTSNISNSINNVNVNSVSNNPLITAKDIDVLRGVVIGLVDSVTDPDPMVVLSMIRLLNDQIQMIDLRRKIQIEKNRKYSR